MVRRIFTMAAEGKGLCKIADLMNQSSERPPRNTEWEKNTIRQILYRELYRGVLVYGRTKRGYRKGTAKKSKRAESDLVRVTLPDLAIVSPELWDAAHERLGRTRNAYLRTTAGRMNGTGTRNSIRPTC